MSGSEIIRLDAQVVGVVAKSVFRARLANGHEIVAYAARDDDRAVAEEVEVGETVTVEMSPYDMASGRMVSHRREFVENESQEFS